MSRHGYRIMQAIGQTVVVVTVWRHVHMAFGLSVLVAAWRRVRINHTPCADCSDGVLSLTQGRVIK